MLNVIQIAVLKDNYNFILHDDVTGQTAVVDPSEAQPILDILKEKGWQLDAILNTHHHWDHVGGNKELQAATGCEIIGNINDYTRIPGITRTITPGEPLSLLGETIDVLDVPGHTIGHIAYYFPKAQKLFCGDTLFAMGCGRLFEGSYKQMFHSLKQLKTLPEDTEIYCAHEYTEANGTFALSIEPENHALQERMEKVIAMRAADQPTIPTTLKEELATNPFLRAGSVEEFASIRKAKDVF